MPLNTGTLRMKFFFFINSPLFPPPPPPTLPLTSLVNIVSVRVFSIGTFVVDIVTCFFITTALFCNGVQ